jgi:DNA-binding response OmpR family regulator
MIGTDLTDMSGFRICKEIRSRTDSPIIMLTSSHEDSIKFIAYESGADRFIEKPFNEATFELTVRSMLRIRYPSREMNEIEASGVKMNLGSKTVSVQGRAVPLTQTEYMILEYMMRNAGKAVSRLELIERIWGFEQCTPTSTVNIHIKNLRDKLGPGLIDTIRGYGYRLNEKQTKRTRNISLD